MNDFEKYTLIISALGVIVTAFVVVVAIWGEKLRQIWANPKLKITLGEPTLNTTTSGVKGWYYLIRISNERPSSPAQNTRLILTKIFKIGPNGSWQERNFSGPNSGNVAMASV